MPTPEELAKLKADEDAKAAAELAEKAKAEAKAKLEQEAKEKAEAEIKAEAEKKVAEEQQLKAFNEAAKVEAEKLLKAALDKQAHDREVEKNVRRLRAEKELGEGDPAKLKVVAELAKRGLAAIDPDGKMAAAIEAAGLGDDADVLRGLSNLGNAVSNDSFKIPGFQPPKPKKPLTMQEKVVRWNGTQVV